MSVNKIFNFCLLFTLASFCHNLNAAIDADVSIATYYQDDSPFAELSLHIVGSTLTEKKLTGGEIETRVFVLITVMKDDEIVDYQKYGLISPQAELATDFIDLRRFVLPVGQYKVSVELRDQLNSKNIFTAVEQLEIVPLQKEMTLSKISLLSSVSPSESVDNPFFKYGNVMEPAAFGFFHQSMNQLYVFAELYNSSSEFTEDYAVKYSVFNVDENKEILAKYKRFSPTKKEVLLQALPISDLTSGNYEMKVEVVNSSTEVILIKSVFFQRSNPSKDQEFLLANNYDLEGSFINDLSDDELEYNLKALAPRLNSMEITTVNELLSSNSQRGQRFYLYNYWVSFDPVNTEATFNQYNEIVQAVDRMFYNTVGRGFETDRGYIFLKYGRPNNVITVENEPSAPPYEIWFYDELDLTRETNIKFLFYNPSLAGYNFQLLHSNSRYEKQNRQWEVELYADAPNEINDNRIDATGVVKNVNRRAREYFNDNN